MNNSFEKCRFKIHLPQITKIEGGLEVRIIVEKRRSGLNGMIEFSMAKLIDSFGLEYIAETKNISPSFLDVTESGQIIKIVFKGERIYYNRHNGIGVNLEIEILDRESNDKILVFYGIKSDFDRKLLGVEVLKNNKFERDMALNNKVEEHTVIDDESDLDDKFFDLLVNREKKEQKSRDGILKNGQQIPVIVQQDKKVERFLFEDVEGQRHAIKSIKLAMEAAKRSNSTMGHIIIYGYTRKCRQELVEAIINESGLNYKKGAFAYEIKSLGELTTYLSSLKESDLFVMDEVDQLNDKGLMHILVDAVNYFSFDITLETGEQARRVKIELPNFTGVFMAEDIENVHHDIIDTATLVLELVPPNYQERMAYSRKWFKERNLIVEELVLEVLAEKKDTAAEWKRKMKYIYNLATAKGINKVNMGILDDDSI